MRFLLLASLSCVLEWAIHPEVRAEDGIVIPLVRIEGTIPKADDPIFNITGFNGGFGRQDTLLEVVFNGRSVGEFAVVATKDKVRCVVYADFGGDKKLKALAEKLVGQRVVVECKGEYKLYFGVIDLSVEQPGHPLFSKFHNFTKEGAV